MEEKIIACEYCRWARDEMNWKYCPDCGLPTDPLSAFKKIEIHPSQPSEQKPPEENFYCADWNRCGAICEEQCPTCKKTNNLEAVKTAEEITWKYFGSTRTYSREKIIEAMQEYAQQSRQQARIEAIQKCIESVKALIALRFGLTLNNQIYYLESSEVLNELETLKHNP